MGRIDSINAFYVQYKLAPARIQNLFTHVSDIHPQYNTRSATTNNFYVTSSRLELLKEFILISRFRVRLWNALVENIKRLPVETFLRNKYMKHYLIFLNKRIGTLYHLQIFEIIKKLWNCSNSVTSINVVKSLSLSSSFVKLFCFAIFIPRVERLCPLCNRSEIGDGFHYLLKCTHSSLSHIRDIFL